MNGLFFRLTLWLTFRVNQSVNQRKSSKIYKKGKSLPEPEETETSVIFRIKADVVSEKLIELSLQYESQVGEPVTPAPPVPNAMQNLSLQDKIELLCNLFNPNFLCLPIDLLHKISKRCIFASPKNLKKVYGLMV